MRKTMKYETPEIEVTRFDVATAIMDETTSFYGEGETKNDGDLITVPGLSYEDSDDFWD